MHQKQRRQQGQDPAEVTKLFSRGGEESVSLQNRQLHSHTGCVEKLRHCSFSIVNARCSPAVSIRFETEEVRAGFNTHSDRLETSERQNATSTYE